jgi:GNAT superfamily N-acetyltransferase
MLVASHYLLGRFMAHAKDDRIINYNLSLLQSAVASGAIIYGVFQDSQLVGMACLENLSWDSKIYNKRMGTINHLFHTENDTNPKALYHSLLSYITEQAYEAGYDFLLCKTLTDHIDLIHALQKTEFLLVDTLLDYLYRYDYKPLETIAPPHEDWQTLVREARAEDLDVLLAIAKASFGNHFGRYHADERTSNEVATRVYQEWIRASLAGYGDLILVAEIDGQVAGYTVWRNPSEQDLILGRLAHYSIAGIHPDYAGHGLFRVLTYAGMHYLQLQADYIIGPTHINNYPVQRGYEKLGWRIYEARHSFHKWLR